MQKPSLKRILGPDARIHLSPWSAILKTKLEIIADKEMRPVSNLIEWIAKKYVFDYEQKNGEITDSDMVRFVNRDRRVEEE